MEDTTLEFSTEPGRTYTLTTSNNLWVKVIVEEKKTQSGLHLPDTIKGELFIAATVLLVGPEVKQIKPGDIVYFPRHQIDNIQVRNSQGHPETVSILSEDDVKCFQRVV